MGYNSRFFSILLACTISVATTGFLYIADHNISWGSLSVVAGISFSSSFIFTFLILEYLIFNQISDLHKVLQKIKKNDGNVHVGRRNKNLANPFQKLNQ